MRTGLRFTKFQVWQVVVPVRHDILAAPPSASALSTDNLVWPEKPVHLVEGLTSDGFTAVGECLRGTSMEVIATTLRSLLGVDLLAMTPSTVWMQATEISGLPTAHPVWSWQVAVGRSYQLMESLWLDAVGKASALPAYQLLGGAIRKEVAVDFWANRPSSNTLLALVKEARDRGLRGMKLKSDGAGDTVQSLAAIARDLPVEFRFTMDPMYAWRSLRESHRLFGQLAGLPCQIQVEDPFPWTNLEDWRRARDVGRCAIICHVREEPMLQWVLREQIADAFNMVGAGAFDFCRTASAAEFASKDCWHGSTLELGVLQHLHLHAAACARNCVLASDLQSEWVREHTLVTPRMSFRNGFALVPDRPGLGVELDREALGRYCKRKVEIA